MASADVINKIRNLRARAADAASTEGEAEMAIKIAAKLMAEHNLTLDDIGVKAEGVKADRWGPDGKHRPVAASAWFGVQKLCNVRIIRDNACAKLIIVGNPTDVETAFYYLDIVNAACKACWDTYFKTWECREAILKHGSQRGVSQDFKKGVAYRLGERMAEMAKQRDGEQTAQGQGLVVVKDALINSYVREKIGKLSQGKGAINSQDAYSAGKVAGNSVGLNTGVSGQRRVLALA
jgi:hypothetical protein